MNSIRYYYFQYLEKQTEAQEISTLGKIHNLATEPGFTPSLTPEPVLLSSKLLSSLARAHMRSNGQYQENSLGRGNLFFKVEEERG